MEKKKFLKNRIGLTLIELTVVIAIMAVISVVAFLGLTGYRGDQNLKLSLAEFITVMRDTQRRSIAQESGSQWGMKLTNSNTNGSYYEVFKGTNYVSGAPDNKFYALKRDVKFSEPYVLSTYQIVFAPLSGVLVNNKIISLLGGDKGEAIGDVILNTLGLVSSRIEKGIIGYWHFDEGNGVVVHDASSMKQNGNFYIGDSSCDVYTPNFCPTWQGVVSCKAGNCLDFNTGAYGEPANYILGDFNQQFSSFTIEAWVRLGDNQNKGAVWSGYAGDDEKIFGRFKASSRVPSFYTSPGGELNSSRKLVIGQWYYLAYVYDGSYKRIYIDGAQDISFQLRGANFSLDNFEIGRSEKDNHFVFHGKLDEVRFYKRALTGSEILDHYNDLK